MSAEKQVPYSSLMSIFTVIIPFILLSRYWERRKWEKEKQLFSDNRMPFEFQCRARNVKQLFVLAKGTQSVSWLFAGLATCFACFVQIAWAYFRHVFENSDPRPIQQYSNELDVTFTM